jgi:L-lactate dehydrogenase complex protein LldF
VTCCPVPLLSTSGTGQQVTVYNTVYFGPRQPGEVDGPTEMVVILLDNGRTNLLARPDRREALRCIRCGACLNVCPVYKNIGGHTYETTYSGPIGSVISPHLSGLKEHQHLSFASSLCGACTSVCPVRINLHNLLLLNRQESVSEGHNATVEKVAIGLWRWSMQHRWALDILPGRLKDFSLGYLLDQSGWRKRRESLKVADKSFRELWQASH